MKRYLIRLLIIILIIIGIYFIKNYSNFISDIQELNKESENISIETENEEKSEKIVKEVSKKVYVPKNHSHMLVYLYDWGIDTFGSKQILPGKVDIYVENLGQFAHNFYLDGVNYGMIPPKSEKKISRNYLAKGCHNIYSKNRENEISMTRNIVIK